ncbi:MAG: DUF4234 domain-containing protein [Solirubrobacterales bacterium]|nr:DUF4234 domain-containing protein [Solirubrobacterales bacterium]
MAQELEIRNTNERVKLRSPWAAALLPIVTLGIYHVVWWYRINRELRDLGQAKGYDLGQNPTNSLLALFPGGLILVPALITYWRGGERIQGAARLAGKEPINGLISVVLFFVISPALWWYMQDSLNGIWRSEATALPGEAPPPELRDQMPPRLTEHESPAAEPYPSGPTTAQGE